MNVLLVGYGPNAIRNHLPFLRNNAINLAAIIELESQRNYLQSEVESFWCKPSLLFLDDKYKDDYVLPDETRNQFMQESIRLGITHVIINSEPKAHMMYMDLFVDLPVRILLEKPILAPNTLKEHTDVQRMMQQYNDMRIRLENGIAKDCQIMCQRRCNPAYDFIDETLRSVIEKYDIPVTGVSIDHCDGNWMMPHDLFYENHPYMYGYGKLFHSGYHFIDLFSRIIQTNSLHGNKAYDKMNIASSFITTHDEQSIITLEDYHRLFNSYEMPSYYSQSDLNPQMYAEFGDKNIVALVSLLNKQGRTLALARLGIAQLGFSRRGWINTKDNHYKGNGRIRHENVDIQVGPLMSIKVHSYQSSEVGNDFLEPHKTGGQAHFDIDIFRNSEMIGGRVYENFTVKDFWPKDGGDFHDLNSYSRYRFLEIFFSGKKIMNNAFGEHRLGMELMASLSHSLIEHRQGNFTTQTIYI